MSGGLTTRAATAQDITRIVALLRANDLPTEDLAESRPDLVVMEDGTELIGVGGMERFGELALLRSVAVAQERRRAGIGSILLGELERYALDRGVRELVLLTQTAEGFFARHGYHRIERAGLPEPIQATAEFRSLCPASAVCMRKRLE